jgi:hypothetical protein
MAIYERQYQELLTRELLKILLKGKLPNIREITAHLTELTKDKVPVYKFIPQARRDVFNNELFNRQLNSIDFDVHILHQEILAQVQEAMRRLNYADLYHKVHSYELQRLGSLLNSILFTFENADFFFLSAFDSFTDYSKTNRDESTRDIINLPEKAIMLPYGGRNTQRVHTNHMYKHTSWPVTLLLPNEELVVSKSQVSNTEFGSVFSDVVNSWMYEVVTRDQGDVAIQVKFPLAGPSNAEVEVQINRFEVVPFSVTPQRVKVEFSTDDVNWKTPEGYETGLLMEDQKLTYAMDFITELVQFIRLTITKADFDEEIPVSEADKQFLYRFGLKGFSAFTVGRLDKARYQSKPFTFVGQEENISRVSMKADTSTPDGTEVNFSVALADEDGGVTTSFLPIKPINGDAKPGATEVVVFGTTEPHSLRFMATAGQFAERETFRGHKFYKFTKPIVPNAVFGTASMLRGHQVWYRDANVALTRTEVRDNHVTFSKVDIEHLYTTVTEVPVHRSFTSATINKPIVELTAAQPPYYTKGIHDLIPNFNQSKGDMTPTYAVYRVEAIADVPRPSFTIPTGNKAKIQLPHTNFVLTGADAPVVTNNTNTITYVTGRDYVIETETIGGQAKPTGFLLIIPKDQGGTIYETSTNVTLSISLVLDADVTYKVTDIQANKVTLTNMLISAADSFKITYRYVPLPPNTIEKSSVRVKDNISNTPNVKFFVEGVDYVLDTRTGAIQRLPNGAIPDKASVFVDYLFRNAEENVETFLTWCFIPGTRGRRISFDLDPTTRKNALVADESVGEQFLVNLPAGLIDLTKAERSPVLGPGWVQFIVKSKNPDANQLATGKGNLIDQVVQARDINKKRVFKEKGTYFKDILALRDPMVQVSLNQLRVNTLPSNHSFFALDETKVTEPVVVLNFNPGDTTELYLKVPQDEDSVLVAPLDYFEVFTISWASKLTSESSGSSVVVRCDLSRDDDVDGGITPKVFEYFLRASEL